MSGSGAAIPPAGPPHWRVSAAHPQGRTSSDLALFFDIAHELLALTDPGGHIVDLNPAWEKLLGWTPEEMIGHRYLDFVHPDDHEQSIHAVQAKHQHQDYTPFVNRYRHRDGSYRYLEWTSAGQFEGSLLYAVARDVTAVTMRDRRQRALNAAWLAMASEDSLDAVLGVVNEHARSLIGARQAVTSMTVGSDWGQAITAVALTDHYAPWRDYDDKPDGSGIYAEVVRTNTPMRLSHEELIAHPLWRGFGTSASAHPPMRGWLAVPMIGRSGANLGLIQVSDKEDGTDFDDDDEESLIQFARVAALTVERAQADAAATEALTQVEEMLDSISDAFMSLDREWHVTYLNAAARRLLRRGDEVIGTVIWDMFPDTGDARFLREFTRAVEAGTSVSFHEFHPQLQVWFDVRAFPSASGLAVYFVDVSDRVAVTDDLERRAAMQAVVADVGQDALSGMEIETLLDETALRVAHVLQVTHAGVAQLVNDGHTITARAAVARNADEQWAPVAAALPSWPLETLAGTSIAVALERADWAVMNYPEGRPSLAAQSPFTFGSALSVPIGRASRPWGVFTIGDDRPERFGVREGVFLTQIAHILSSAIERQETENEVRHRASHDALTGLPNRQLLRDRLDAALASPTVDTDGIVLLLLDLDGFKDVNDSLGHATGDIVLVQVADRLRTLVGPADTVARLGGDEFAVVLRGLDDDDQAAVAAREIVHAIAIPFSLTELDVPLSTSVGVVRAPHHGHDTSTLLRRADVAMYRAKSQTSGWAVYDDVVDAARADRLTLIADLRKGIATDQLELHYQPIVDLATGAVVSVEALVRWRHPVDGLVPPLSFIPLAEQSGLITPLTAWVIEEALRQSDVWHARGFHVRIAVNVSVDVLTGSAAADTLLDRFAGSADRITAEITESSLADERSRRAVTWLANQGVSCAVDDFGTGYSSLAYLKELPVAQLKIDRAFVRDVSSTDRDRAIVRSVADLGNALALDVVAEGVEDAESAAALLTCGVRLGQGYHFARPMPADDFDEWLAHR